MVKSSIFKLCTTKIVFTYPDLLPAVLIVELELIHVYRTVGTHLLWKSYDVRPVSMASWNRGFCSPLFCSVLRFYCAFPIDLKHNLNYVYILLYILYYVVHNSKMLLLTIYH